MKLRLTLLLLVSFLTAGSLFPELVQAESHAVTPVSSDAADPLEVILHEKKGLDRVEEPVEIEISLPYPENPSQELIAYARSHIRVLDMNGSSRQEIPSQIFNVRVTSPEEVRVSVAFFATVDANSTGRYRIERDSEPAEYETDLKVTGEGVSRTIENDFFSILTEDQSGQIDQIDLRFADRPSFRFAPGTMHWNPDFIVVPDDYPETSYSWLAARHMEQPDFEVESGPLFFSIRRKQLVPGQDKVFVEVYYRFYAGRSWFVMESRMEAVEDFKTFGLRNDELAFGVGDFTHAGWRAQSTDFHPEHRGEVGTIPLYDPTRPGRHVLGSALSPDLPWLSYSHNERGYAVASLRLGWDYRNLLTGGAAPLLNSRTVLSDNDGAPYWFRSLVYTPRRANDEAFFDLDQEVINEMVQLIPRGSSYYERNVYMFYPFEEEKSYEPVDELYLRLANPLQVEVRE